MALKPFKVKKGLNIAPDSTAAASAGDIRVDSSDSNKIKWHNGTSELTVASTTELNSHVNDTSGAHAASAISVSPTGNLAADDVQEALSELQTDIDTRALDSDLDTHIADTSTHGVTGDVVGTSDEQTLTNKTIDADSNTVSNIENENIKASAGIAVDKLAAVTASRALVSDASGFVSAATTTSTEIGYVNGVTSAIQTQLDGKVDESVVTAKGDLIVGTASGVVARQALGTNGLFLKVDTSQTTGLAYGSPAGATLVVTSIDSSDSPYSSTSSNDIILCDTSGGAITINLPEASLNSGKILRISKTTDDSNLVTLDGNSTETIRGAATYVLGGINSSVEIFSDGSNWLVRAETGLPAAKYYASASTSNSTFADNTTEIVDFDTKVVDTHNAVTTGASWKFTVPPGHSGIYVIDQASIQWSTNASLNSTYISLYKSGTDAGYISRAFGIDESLYSSGTTVVQLDEGDYVDIRVIADTADSSSRAVQTGSIITTYFSIHRCA